MAQYDTLKATIDAYIRANYAKAITGPVLNGVLDAMVDSLGTGFQFMGEATPATDPGRPDQNVAYIAATAGTYEDFANLTLPSGKVGLFTWDGSWHLTVLDIPTEEAVPTKTSDILNDSGFITNAVADLANYYLKTETYTAAQVDQLVASLTHIEFVVAPSLPTASAATMNKIYLVPSAMPSSGDVKDEYVTLKNGNTYTWEQIGRTTSDVFWVEEGVTTFPELKAAIQANKICALDAGEDNGIYYLVDYYLEEGNEYAIFTHAVESQILGVVFDPTRNPQWSWFSQRIPTSLSQLSQSSSYRTVTDAEKATWNGKYAKPASGIPASDLDEEAQAAIGKARTAIQPSDLNPVAISGSYEDLSNTPGNLSDFSNNVAVVFEENDDPASILE